MRKEDGHADDCVFTALATALERLDKQQDDLLRLTPSGSEFVGDWKRCLEFVSDRMATVGKLAKRAKALEDALATALERLDEWEEAAEVAAQGGHGDEKHCTCVPLLRTKLDKAERRVEALEKFKRFILNKYDHQQNPDYAYEKWLEQEKAESQVAIEALEADDERTL